MTGAQIFIEIEKPHEMALRDLKLEKTKEVDAAIDYLKKTFWHYGNNEERYNYTQEEFRKYVSSSSCKGNGVKKGFWGFDGVQTKNNYVKPFDLLYFLGSVTI